MERILNHLDRIAANMDETPEVARMLMSDETRSAITSSIMLRHDILGFQGIIDDIYILYSTLEGPDRTNILREVVSNLSQYRNPTDAYYDVAIRTETQLGNAIVQQNDQFRNYYKNEKSLYDAPELVEESIGKCRRCGMKTVAVRSRQLRSADEPETRLYKCTTCGKEWR